MVPRRLDSWKEIARYLGRDVTTVRRWEKREGLPVHRHVHDKLGSVYGYTEEIDSWWARRSTELARPDPQTPPPPSVRQDQGRMKLATLALLSIVVAGTNNPWAPPARAGDRAVIRFALTAPPGTVIDALEISPDGEHVAAAASGPGGARLWILRLDSTHWEPLPGTEGAAFPFWSPDGQNIGFFAAGRLKHLAVASREVRDLAAAPEPHGGAWNDRGDIVFAAADGAPLVRIRASGGAPVPVTKIGQAHKEGHAWPQFLPDGRRVLYTDYCADSRRYGIYVADLDSGEAKRVLPVYSSARYSPDGFLVYAKGTLVAQRFDLARTEVVGEPVSVADRVLQRYGLGHRVDLSVSRTGVIVARSVESEDNRLIWIDRSGREVGGVSDPGYYSNPALSPDGRRFLATIDQGSSQSSLWLFDVENGERSRLTSGALVDYAPVWNGDRIIFSSAGKQRKGLFERRLGSGADTPVASVHGLEIPESWSTDGRYLTVQTIRKDTRFDVWARELDGERRAFPILKTVANEGHSRISPDGRFVAYVSDESGRFEVYVQTFPTPTAERWLVSSSGGFDPRWSTDGRELYYIAADRRMMAVGVRTRPTFQRGTAMPLFDTQLEDLWEDTRNHYDVSPDGRRFLILAPAAGRFNAPYRVLVNWQGSGSR